MLYVRIFLMSTATLLSNLNIGRLAVYGPNIRRNHTALPTCFGVNCQRETIVTALALICYIRAG